MNLVQQPGPQPYAPQVIPQAAGPMTAAHSALLQQALADPGAAQPQTAPQLGVDLLAQAVRAQGTDQAQANAAKANATLPGLNSALGDLGIDGVQPFSAADPPMRPGIGSVLRGLGSNLGGLFGLGASAGAGS